MALWKNLTLRQTVFAFFILESLLITSLPVSADETDQARPADDVLNLSLEELMNISVFSASRKEESIESAPQIVTVITLDQMRRLGITTVNDALSLVPGYDFQKERKEYHWTRGNRESALMMIDGVSVLNPADNEAYFDEAFQIENIERIEVLRGPGGVLWGTNAFLGVVNIITKNPTKKPFFELNSSVGSFNYQRVGFAASNMFDDIGVFFSGKYLTTEKQNIWLKNSPKKGSNYDNYYADLSGKITVGGWTLSARTDSHKEYSALYDIVPVLFTDTATYEKDPIHLVQLKYNGKISETITFNGSSAYLYRTTELYIPFDSQATDYFWYKNLTTSRWNTDLQFDHNLFKDTNVVYGVSYDKIRGYNSKAEERFGGVFDEYDHVIPNAEVQIAGTYLQATQKLSSKLTVGGGIREELSDVRLETESQGGYKEFESSPQELWKLNAVYRLDRGDVFKLIASKGFRRPDFEQMIDKSIFGTGELYNLKNEEAYSYEAGYTLNLAKSWKWDTNYSYNKIHGLIDYVRVGDKITSVFDSANLPNATIHAVESEVRYQTEEGSFGFVNFSYKDGKTNDGDQFSIVNTNKVSANAAYSHMLTEKVIISNTLQYVGSKNAFYQENDGLSPVDVPEMKKVPSYLVWNIGLIFPQLGGKNLEGKIFVYNLLDKEYYSQPRINQYGYLYPQPGRNLMATLTYRF